MWNTYIEKVKEYDKRVSDAWKDDATGLLVFTGLFSAIVGAFIIESYKKLSPDPGDETVDLLKQISRQLAGFNGTYPNLPIKEPPGPSTPIIVVNVMWLMSLVLSITSALFATLLQQWARRYIQMPEIPSSVTHRARVRSFLFRGTLKYNMRLAVEIVPTLLHLSVFLFFTGLVIFFFPIHKAAAIAVSVSVGLFAVIYFALTILPYFGHSCPYRTPMSFVWWYPWHALLSLGALCLRWVVRRLHDWLIPYNLGQDVSASPKQAKLQRWYESCEDAVKNYRYRLTAGLGKSIIKGALDAPVVVDREALTRLFDQLTLADKSELPKFVASIPKDRIVHLMTPPIESGKIVFRDQLTLIRNCGTDRGLDKLDNLKDVRKRCLTVCLEAVRHIAKALIVANTAPQPEVLHDIRTNFANIGLMREIWTDNSNDTAILVTSRSICALLARRLLHKEQLEGLELAWLEDMIGKPSHEIYSSHSRGDFAVLDLNNLKSFVSSVLPHLEGDLPTEHAISFTETLAILMDAGTQAPFNSTIFSHGISDLIHQMEDDDVANKLRTMFGDFLSPPAPASAPEPAPAPTPVPVPTANRCRRVFRLFCAPETPPSPSLALTPIQQPLTSNE